MKKSSGTSFDKSIKQLGSGLMRGLRSATACFNPAALSSKVHDFNPDAVAQSTAFARDRIKVQEQKLQERMTTSPQAKQAPRASAGAGRPPMSTSADKPNKASNAAPPPTPHASGMREQKRFNAFSDDFVRHFNKVNVEMRAGESRPHVKAQQGQRQTFNVTCHQPQSIDESFGKMSEAEARKIVERGVGYDSTPRDHAQLKMAEKRLAEIQERKESAGLQQKIDNALNPGGKNTRVSPMHVRLHHEQKECEGILQQQPHHNMSHAELNELWANQKTARKKLDKLERFAVFDNAQRARTEKMTLLQGDMARVERALDNLNKRDPNHRDFDGDLLGLPNASQLARKRADLENKLANLKLDFDLTGCESTVAQWTRDMESGKKAPREDAVNNVLDTLIDVSKTGKMLNQGSDDSTVVMTRLQNVAQQIEMIKRGL